MSKGLIFLCDQLRGFDLGSLENGNITDHMKKGEIAEILYKAIERMNN